MLLAVFRLREEYWEASQGIVAILLGFAEVEDPLESLEHLSFFQYLTMSLFVRINPPWTDWH